MIEILCFLETASSSNFLQQQGQMTEAGGVFANHLGGNNSGWHGDDPVTGHHQQGLNYLPEGSTRSRGDIAVPHRGDGEDGPVDASGKIRKPPNYEIFSSRFLFIQCVIWLS